MNKTYRTIYNEATQTWVAVSEVDHSNGKSTGVVNAVRKAKCEDKAISTFYSSKTNGCKKKKIFLAEILENFFMGGYVSLLFTAGMVSLSGSVHAAAYNAGGGTALNKESVAIGNEASATGTVGAPSGWAGYAVAIGYKANAAGVSAIALGSNAQATGAGAYALGNDSVASGESSLALGRASTATGAYALSFGWGAFATETHSTALGYKAQSTAHNAIAIGAESQAVNKGMIAIGENAGVNNIQNSRYIYNIAIGEKSGQNVPGQYNIAMGNNAGSTMTVASDPRNGDVIPQDNIAIGRNAGNNLGVLSRDTSDAQGAYTSQMPGNFNVAIGSSSGSNLQGAANVALGRGAGNNVIGLSNLALGGSINNQTGATISGDYNIALGSGSGNTVSGNSNTAIGHGSGANVTGERNVALGGGGKNVIGSSNFATGIFSGNNVTGDGNINMNGSGKVTGHNNIAIGSNAGGELKGDLAARKPNSNNIAIGTNAGAASTAMDAGGNIAIGLSAGKVVTGTEQTFASTVSLGNETKVGGTNAVAIAFRAQANGAHAISVGANSNSRGDSAMAVGMMSNAIGGNAIALGRQANASVGNTLAVGYQASASAANAIAIGSGAQATNRDTISIGTGNIVSGRGSSAVGDPSIIAGSNSFSAGNNNAVGSATDNAFILGGVNDLGGTAVTRNANGVITTANGIADVVDASHSAIVGYKNSVQDTNVFVMGNEVKVGAGMSGAVVLGNQSDADQYIQTTSATVNGVTYKGFSGSGTLSDGAIVSVGAVDAERQIKNVAAGQISATSTDAINGSQLYATQAVIGNVASSTTTVLGGDAAVDADGNITMSNIGGTGENNVNDAIAYTAQGWNLSANGGSVSNIAPGDSVDLNNTDGNITINNNNGNVGFSLADTVKIGSTSPVTIDGTAGTVGGLTNTTWNADNITSGQAATEDQLKQAIADVDSYSGWNLTTTASEGTATDSSTEAIGEAETVSVDAGKNIALTQNGNSISIATADDLEVSSVTAGNTVLNNNGLSITDGPSVTSDGINAGNNKVTNVAAGAVDADSTDAVNGSQLYETNQTVEANTTAIENNANSIQNNATNIAANANDIATNTADIAKGINFGDGTNSNNFALGETISVVGDNNITSTATTEGVQLGLANTVTIGTDNPIAINGTAGTVGGLTNTTWNADSITSGQAATEDQLKQAIADVDSYSGWNLTTTASEGTATGSSTEAIGEDETVSVDAGKNIALTQNGNSISIATADDLEVSSVTAGNTVINTNGITINGGNNSTVSLSNNGLDNGSNTITNVAAGVNGTDAVNVSQLNVLGNSTASSLGGTSAYDAATNTVTAGLTVNGNTYSSVQEALSNIETVAGNSSWTLSTDEGTASNVTSGSTVSFGSSDGNVVVSNEGNNVTVDLAKDITVDSVTAGDTTLNNEGVSVGDNVALTKDGLSVGDVSVTESGLNNGGNKITNVAAGTDDTDAVNVSQLKAAQAASTTKVAAGDNIEVATSTNADGSTTYTVATAKDLTADSLTAGNTTVNNEGLSISGGPSVTTSGINAAGTKVTNVAAGDISASSTDAVNGSQLYATNSQVAANTEALTKGLGFTADSGDTVNRTLGSTVAITGDSNITTATNSNGVQVSLNKTLTGLTSAEFTNAGGASTNVSGSGTVVTDSSGNTTTTSATGVVIQPASGDEVSLTESGLNNGGNTITNVAPGVNGTDAVNVNQLNSIAGNINNINNRIEGVERNANAGTATAMAVAGLPQAYLPGKSMMAIAGGVYRGESGYAVGFSSISDGGNWVVKGTASGNSRGHYGATAGVGYQW